MTAMHLLPCTVTAGLVLTAAAGCASNNHPPAVRAPLTSITRSRAHVVAPLLTIRWADLPEFKVAAHAVTQKTQHAASEVQCPGRRHTSGEQRPWASARSDRLSANSGYQMLGAWSKAEITPTAAAARRDVGEAARLKVCVEHALRSGLLRSALGPLVRGITVEPIQVNVKGADASAAYRAIVATRGAPLVDYIDMIFFSYGQDVFALGTYHFSKPVPPAMEQRLQGLLIARARSHSR